MSPDEAVVDTAAAAPQLAGYGPWLEVTESRFDAYEGTDAATLYVEITTKDGRTVQSFSLAQRDEEGAA